MGSAQAERLHDKPPAPEKSRRKGNSLPGLRLSVKRIEEFISWLSDKGHSENTVKSYHRGLNRLYEWLPAGKQLRRGTIAAWREALLQCNMAPATAEFYVSATNSMLEYYGRQDLQASLVRVTPEAQPELNRREYLQLLSAAKRTGAERTYLVVKSIGILGVNASELARLTVAAVEEGEVTLSACECVRVPQCLRRELLDYADRNEIKAGPILLSGTGKPLDRSTVWRMVTALSRDACVDEAKCNPRCLKRMCLQTRKEIRLKLERMEERMYDRLLEREQRRESWAD